MKNTQRPGAQYASYLFVDKDPVIGQVQALVEKRGVSLAYVTTHSGVTGGTLRSWFSGKTRRPQHATVQAVAKCLGYSFKLVKDK